MGAGYGHIMHPYEDKDLTFEGLSKIMKSANSGFNESTFLWEKTDGINMMLTWKGTALFARNKGQMSGFGNGAMDASAVSSHFSSLPEVQRVVGSAASFISKTMSLSGMNFYPLFEGGKNYISLEIMHPSTANVIHYMRPIIAIHGVVEVDESGNKLRTDIGSNYLIDGLISVLSCQKKSSFCVIGQSKPKIVPSMVDHTETVTNYWKNRGDELVSDWAKRKVSKIVLDRMIQDSISIDTDVVVRRIFDGDKEIDLRSVAKLYGKEASSWLKALDKSASQIKRQAMDEVIGLVTTIGANILSQSTDLIVGKDRALAKLAMAEAYRSSIIDIMDKGNASDKARYYRELNVIRDLGGIDKMPPMEGVIFDYNGKVYKLTGLFGPVHRINSIMKFKKTNLSNAEPNSITSNV